MNLLKPSSLIKPSIRSVHYLRSKLFIPSATHHKTDQKSKTNKNETKSISCSILENNGFIENNGTGTLTHLPLGKRVINKLTHLVRNEMNKISGQEIEMPSLSDLSLWSLTGRTELIGTELFKLTDRKDKQLCLCPTHEEVVTNLVSKLSKAISPGCLGENSSLRLYQITRKYRDESRPKHGLLRAKEFLMKDMYTFHLSDECVEQTYNEVCKAYETTFEKLDLKYIKAAASVGSMGGKRSHEYHIESNIGEDKVFTCKQCNKSISSDLVENLDKDKIKSSDLCKGIGCTNGNDELIEHKKCIEIGHTFILGERYTKFFPIHTKLDQTVKMGCYGIGVSRLMQACIESHNVDKIYPEWPLEIAPFQIGILPAKNGSKFEEKSKKLVPYLCEMLDSHPLFRDDVLVDDRTWLTIGNRLIDAKLAGVPFIIVLGKIIEDEQVEILINSKHMSEKLGKDKLFCHSRETAHVLKQLVNDYLYAKKQSKLASYFA